MRVFITGGTGFIGRALVPALQRDGHTVVVWTRSAARARARLGADIETVDAAGGSGALIQALEGCGAVVNLAGEPILGRWTARRRQAIRTSRVEATQELVRALAAARQRPRVLVSGSAVGYYGHRGDETLTEASPPGEGFLADVCQAWEAAARDAEAAGVRVVLLRTGVVLGRDGGALAPMRAAFSLGLGGTLGGGRQFVPWIHLHDMVRIIVEALVDERLTGPINVVAPEAARNRDLTTCLAEALHRPAIVPVPAFAVRMALGDAAAVALDSQRVQPEALRRLGHPFTYPTLRGALADLTGGAPVDIGPLTGAVETYGSDTGRRYLEARRPVYELRTTTMLTTALDQSFVFFSKAENLGLLTPSSMRFSIRGQAPAIGEDTTIEYHVRVGLLPITWRSRIVTWRPGERFVDLQEAGPYRSWWHEHTFRAAGAGTVMEDRVCYTPPFGLLGRLANRLFIVPTLRRIFRYRADVIRLRFGAA